MRRRLTTEEIAEREGEPTPLTRFTFRHSWIAGLIAGMTMTGVVLGNDGHWALAVAIGGAVMLWTGLVWRPGGPGQR